MTKKPTAKKKAAAKAKRTKKAQGKAAKKKAAKKKAAKKKTAKKKTAKKKGKRGRPHGSRTKDRDNSTSVPSCCKSCGSTQRTAYVGKPIVTNLSGVTTGGQKYNQITRRKTSCKVCKQHRYDLSFDFVKQPAAKKSA